MILILQSKVLDMTLKAQAIREKNRQVESSIFKISVHQRTESREWKAMSRMKEFICKPIRYC